MSMRPTDKTPFDHMLEQGMMSSDVKFGALNPAVFDKLIKASGVRMIHMRPVPCPNIQEIYSATHDPNCTLCSNGMVYYGHKELIGAVVGNTIMRQFGINGSLDIDQAMVILPSKYDDGTECDIQIFDRIQIIGGPDVRYYQRVEHNQIGIDRLHFPATSVDFLIGSDGTRFIPGVDVEVTSDGYLRWISSNRPGYDTVVEKGRVYSVNYYTRPILTVVNLPHQLRVTQTIKDGKPVQERFPQSAVVRKEFIPHQPNDPAGAPTSAEPG
jgi:hypothetical protein